MTIIENFIFFILTFGSLFLEGANYQKFDFNRFLHAFDCAVLPLVALSNWLFHLYEVPMLDGTQGRIQFMTSAHPQI